MTGRLRCLAVPWFTAETWPELRRVAADHRNLPDTFAEFERMAGCRFAELKATACREGNDQRQRPGGVLPR
jgi:hypothetical protein